mgnify:CR=1 FL=1
MIPLNWPSTSTVKGKPRASGDDPANLSSIVDTFR